MTVRSCNAGESAVTEAEAMAFGGTHVTSARPFDEIERLVASIVRSAWWALAGGPPAVARAARADAGSSSTTSLGGGVDIRFATGQLDASTVIHELAHALVGVARAHDAAFRRADLDLAAVVDGASTARRLEQAFAAFDLHVAARRWPAPFRAEGTGFVVVP